MRSNTESFFLYAAFDPIFADFFHLNFLAFLHRCDEGEENFSFLSFSLEQHFLWLLLWSSCLYEQKQHPKILLPQQGTLFLFRTSCLCCRDNTKKTQLAPSFTPPKILSFFFFPLFSFLAKKKKTRRRAITLLFSSATAEELMVAGENEEGERRKWKKEREKAILRRERQEKEGDGVYFRRKRGTRPDFTVATESAGLILVPRVTEALKMTGCVQIALRNK